jgi:hypothetical protein
MITISQAVENSINNKPFIIEALSDGIINYSSLAEFIRSDIENTLNRPANIGAIVMAIRRYESSKNVDLSKKISKLVKKLGDIVVRSNLVDYTFRNSDTLLKKQQRLLKLISERREFFYAISQGVYETTFVLSDQIKDNIPEIFEGEKLLTYSFGLSSITIKLPTENTDQPGLYYFIFRKLAWEGINVLEVVSTSNEFTVILKDSDIDKAFSVIKRMKE